MQQVLSLTLRLLQKNKGSTMKIQLINCKSYGINGFKFLRDKVYTTDDETGKYLISTGDFVEVNSSEQEDKISE